MKKENCFKCSKEIIRKYVLAKKAYSLKNNWEYWTEKEEHKDKYICNACLLDLYHNDKGEYLEEVQNKKKRYLFTNYVYIKAFS